MTTANLVMLGLGVAALIGGLFVLLRRAASAPGVYAGRIAGTMLTALGAALILFALGLAGKLEPSHA